MGRHLLLSAVLLSVAIAGGADVATWDVGAGGLSWDSQGLIKAAVDLSAEYVQPSGFQPADNIVTSVTWKDVGGTPPDFITEGTARVWSNVAGKIGGEDLVMVDGDSTTSTGERFKSLGVLQTGRTFTYDLGASFPANRIVFYPSPRGLDDFVRAYEVKINDGRDFDQNGRPKYVRLRLEELNREPRVIIDFPRQLLRFIELRIVAPNAFEIAEMEVYGEGFVPKARYLSDYIDLGTPVNLGSLQVAAERVAERPGEQAAASLVLQVRNGTDQTPEIYYEVDPETQVETEIDLVTYSTLDLRRRTVRYDSEHWSPWSSPLEMSAAGDFELDLRGLPGPRQFFQFDLTFSGTSEEIMRARGLSFTYSLPLASAGVAEVAQSDDPFPGEGLAIAPTGEQVVLVYGVRAVVGAGTAGFDGIRIATPTRPRFISFGLGESAAAVEPDSLVEGEGVLEVYFASRRVTAGDSFAAQITFETTPLLYNTLFSGWLLDTGGDLAQPLEAGEATAEIGTNALVVYGTLGGALNRFGLSSSVVTPNGDGRNDVVEVSYDLVHLVAAARVEVVVHDLAGRRIRSLFAGRRSAGRFSELWDGRDEDGNTVPPGHYICTVSVETQRRTYNGARPLAVAY